MKEGREEGVADHDVVGVVVGVCWVDMFLSSSCLCLCGSPSRSACFIDVLLN